METSNVDADKDDSNKLNKKTIYIIIGIVVFILIVVLVIVLVVVLSDTEESNELTTSQKLDIVVSEIVIDCEEKAASSGNFSCGDITEEQRETLTEIFSEFNKDGDDEWSFEEFEAFFMDSGDPELIFDEFDTDDDGEIDFVEMMAGLKVQSTITPDLLQDVYGEDINDIYNMSFNLSNWRWFAYAADLLFYEEFGNVYDGYPNGIKKEDWINITCNREFDYFDIDDDGQREIDLDEFINNAFTGFGIEYFVERTNIENIYDKEEIEESYIETIVDDINSSEQWKEGLSDILSTNSTERRRLLFGKKKKAKDDNCGASDVQQSTSCAGQNPSRKNKKRNSKGCGKNTLGLMACKNKQCIDSGKSESFCKNFINTNV